MKFCVQKSVFFQKAEQMGFRSMIARNFIRSILSKQLDEINLALGMCCYTFYNVFFFFLTRFINFDREKDDQRYHGGLRNLHIVIAFIDIEMKTSWLLSNTVGTCNT